MVDVWQVGKWAGQLTLKRIPQTAMLHTKKGVFGGSLNGIFYGLWAGFNVTLSFGGEPRPMCGAGHPPTHRHSWFNAHAMQGTD